jgi:hypothetical protein
MCSGYSIIWNWRPALGPLTNEYGVTGLRNLMVAMSLALCLDDIDEMPKTEGTLNELQMKSKESIEVGRPVTYGLEKF